MYVKYANVQLNILFYKHN